jgi:hypothetical protein
MFSSSKPAARQPLGYIEDLSPDQTICLNKLKAWLTDENVVLNPWFTDMYLLKFCRARKFNVKQTIQMFKEHLEWRQKYGIDTIVTDFNFHKRSQVFPHYQKGYCGIDKIGRPVYIERMGTLRPDEIWQLCDEEYFWRAQF